MDETASRGGTAAPSQDLWKPSPLFVTMAGREYHCSPCFHRHTGVIPCRKRDGNCLPSWRTCFLGWRFGRHRGESIRIVLFSCQAAKRTSYSICGWEGRLHQFFRKFTQNCRKLQPTEKSPSLYLRLSEGFDNLKIKFFKR